MATEIKKIKLHLLAKRYKIIKFLKTEGYNNEDIGNIMNIDRSWVSRILAAGEKYKLSTKNLLSDKKVLGRRRNYQ